MPQGLIQASSIVSVVGVAMRGLVAAVGASAVVICCVAGACSSTGGDAFTALASAALAILAAGAQHYAACSRHVLAAASYRSLGPDARTRLLAEGGEAVVAIAGADLLLLVPVVVAGAVAAVPRARDLLRGLVRAWPATISFVIMVVLLGVLPRLAVSSAFDAISQAGLQVDRSARHSSAAHAAGARPRYGAARSGAGDGGPADPGGVS